MLEAHAAVEVGGLRGALLSYLWHLIIGAAEGNAALWQRRLRQLRLMLQLATACPCMYTESPFAQLAP